MIVSSLFTTMVSSSIALVHLRIWELEQETDRNVIKMVRNKLFIGLILCGYISSISQNILWVKNKVSRGNGLHLGSRFGLIFLHLDGKKVFCC